MSELDVKAMTELRLRELPGSLNRQTDFVEAVESLRVGCGATFDGVWGSSSALLAAALSEDASGHASGPLVVVAAKPADADLKHKTGMHKTGYVQDWSNWTIPFSGSKQQIA